MYKRLIAVMVSAVSMVVLMAAGLVLASDLTPASDRVVAGDKVKGEKVYNDAKCSICHKVGTKGGKMGPDLTLVGTKRDLAWLKKYLADPKAENPKNKMPKVKATGVDLDNLIEYLLSLKEAS